MAEPHAFISYVRDNADEVDRLTNDLRRAGVKVWVDRDDIAPGQWWRDAIHDAIRTGAFFIACYSKEFDQRSESFMNAELRIAIDRLIEMPRNRLWFVPVMLNDADIPSHRISGHETLRDINAIRLYPDWSAGFEKLLRAMRLDDPVARREMHLTGLLRYHPSERGYALDQLLEMERLSASTASCLTDVFHDLPSGTHRRVLDLARKIGGEATIPVLVEVLQVAEPRLRAGAVDMLADLGPRATDGLVLAMGDADPYVRLRVAWSAGRVGDAALPILTRALGDHDRDVRVTAVREAAKLVPTGFGLIAEALVATDPELRDAAVIAIDGTTSDCLPAMSTLVGEDTVVRILTGSLRSQLPKVRQSAVGLLGRIGEAASEAVSELATLCAKDADICADAAAAAGNIGAAALPVVTALIRDSKEDTRLRAVEAAGRLGFIGLPLLVDRLRDDSRLVRQGAASRIGDLGDNAREAVSALSEALADECPHVRRSAAAALAKIGPASAETLAHRLRDDDVEIRIAAADSLKALGASALVAEVQLIEALSEEDARLRSCAAVALAAVGGKVVPSLIEAFRQGDGWLRWYISGILGAIGADASEATPDLLRAMDEIDKKVRSGAAMALGRIGPSAVVAPVLMQNATDADPHVRWACSAALRHR